MAINIIANSKAGLSRHRPAELTALAAMVHPSAKLHLCDDLTTLHQHLSNLHRQGIDRLAIRGGDGTLGVVLQQLLPIWQTQPLPQLLLLRGGTMNVVASSIGLRGTPAQLLRRYLTTTNPTCVELKPLQIAQRYGFIFGMGCFVDFLRDYYRHPTPSHGLWLLGRTFISMLLQTAYSRKLFQPLTLALQCDQEPRQKQTLTLVTASTVRHAGFNFHPYFLAQTATAPMHLLTSHATPRQLLSQLLRFYRGHADQSATTLQHSACRYLTIEPSMTTVDSAADYCLDGEIITNRTAITIQQGPTLQLLTL